MDIRIGVVGLGYVGLPVAIAFAKIYPVVGFDIHSQRIQCLRNCEDVMKDVSSEELRNSHAEFTDDVEQLKSCNFIIITVPTPIDQAKKPNLEPLRKASETVGACLQPGAIIVYESTVYPGTTEEVCIPILERYSGLSAGLDFHVGYSPERINPGDIRHSFENIRKVVAGQNEKALGIIAEVYGKVVKAGIYKAGSIKVAEAAKVIENTQRDLNIALMNELSIIFHHLDIDTSEVLEAATTKWNFLPFAPGLVGGHCIGVDPYYLTYKAESIGYHPQVILSGRRINDNMSSFIATSIIKELARNGPAIQGATITILGLTFKENVADIRNTKVIDMVREFREFGVDIQVSDPWARADETHEIYGIELIPMGDLRPADAVILAVKHEQYADLGWDGVARLLRNNRGVVGDLKHVLTANPPEGVILWRL